MKNLVVGTGITGSTIAQRLANELNEDVLIIDKNDFLAGSIYDYKDTLTGIIVHKFGPHSFHTNNKEVWDFISQFTDWKSFSLKVCAYIEDKIVNLPFSLKTLHQLFPAEKASEIEGKLIKHYGIDTKTSIVELKEHNDDDLEFIADYIFNYIFKNYSEKQWGIPIENIDKDVLKRVPVYISYEDRYFQDKYQAIPIDGYTKMIENMLNHKNIKILLNTNFNSIEKSKFDRIFYTGSIDEYFNYKYGILPYRSLEFDIKQINKEYHQGTAIVNYPNDFEYTRITEHKHFLDKKSPKTIISYEYPQEFELNKNERYYPISNPNNLALYNKYKDISKNEQNVFFLGRLGDYKYYNMDKAIERAFEVFNEL